MAFSRGYALIIGVGADLPNTVSDAEGFARVLRDQERCAYPENQVTLLTEKLAHRDGILRGLEDIAQRVDNGSTAIIYFSGHGYRIKEPGSLRYFLMPYGYVLDLDRLSDTAIADYEFATALAKIPAQKLLVLLDCCHAAGIEQAKSLELHLEKAAIPPEAEHVLAEGKGRVSLTSSRADQVSFAAKPYSAFTAALLEGLTGKASSKNDGFVRVADLANYTYGRVEQITRKRQSPVFNFKNADNFEVAYYAGGDVKPKAPIFAESIELQSEQSDPLPTRPLAAPRDAARQQRIQVIGWKGIEEKALYAHMPGGYSLAFLTTEMSFETLPTLEYYSHGSMGPERFDAVYMDYEFADRYKELRLIANLQDDREIKAFFNFDGDIAPVIRELMFPGRKPGTMDIHCVPVQFGFNEILLKPKGRLGKTLKEKAEQFRDKTHDTDDTWSHGEFALTELLNDNETRVVVWHWYLPSLLQFLLSAKTTIAGTNTTVSSLTNSLSHRTRSKAETDVLEGHINQVCRLLKKNSSARGRVVIARTMKDVRDLLADGDFNAGVVLGVGSSALSRQSHDFNPRGIKALAPASQGVFVWINCAAAIRKPDRKPATILIKHWLNDATQKGMFQPLGAYIGLPVNRRALNEILNTSLYGDIHAVETLKSLCEESPYVSVPTFKKGRVAYRVLPPWLWGRWVHLWERFVKAVDEPS